LEDAVAVGVWLLGPVEVTGSAVGAGSGLAGRERALLARLALDAGRPVGVERLIDDLWEEDPPAGARNTLQVYVSHLRRALGAGLVESRAGGYGLVLDRSAVDAHRFADLAATGAGLVSAGRAAEAVAVLDEALGLWRGDPLADLAGYGFARLEAARLGELRAGVVEELAAVELARGRHDRVVAEFGSLVEEFPFRERLRAAVMTALYRQGRAADALEVYRTGQVVLREELGLDPGPGLRALQAAILADDPGLVAAAPTARDVGAVPPPAPATVLLGRAGEVAAVAGLVADPGVRLVTVLGPGGTGKTRLVLEVAHYPPEVFAGAVVWVSLVGSDDPGLVLPAVGAALRLQAPDRGGAGRVRGCRRPGAAGPRQPRASPARCHTGGDRAAGRLPRADDPDHLPSRNQGGRGAPVHPGLPPRAHRRRRSS
jgi:DNA-binding SARP family transcriptional activator